jgi:hypothetical protein
MCGVDKVFEKIYITRFRVFVGDTEKNGIAPSGRKTNDFSERPAMANIHPVINTYDILTEK